MSKYRNKPIEIFNAYISTRALNFLIKNNIYTTDNLRDKKSTLSHPQKGFGKISINEIKKILLILEESKEYKNYITNKDENSKYDIRDNMEELYISIKKNKTKGYNSRELRKFPINEYLQSIYQQQKEFNIYNFIESILITLSKTEQIILEYRLNFIGKQNKFLTLSNIGEKTGITHERVRQTENNLHNKLNEIFTSLGKTKIGKEFYFSILKKNNIDEYGLIKLENNNSNININFLGYIISKIINEEYNHYFINKNNIPGNILFIYRKDCLNEKVIRQTTININNFIDNKRIDNNKFYKDIFISAMGGSNLSEIISNIGYETFIILYLEIVFNVYIKNGLFLFESNKKDLKLLVKKEFEKINKIIHFKEMYNIITSKYVAHKRSYSIVHQALMKYGKNVGLGLYVKRTSNMNGGKIGDIAEKYLEKIGKPVDYIQLINYIKKNKITKESSIKGMLFKQDKNNRFVKIKNGKVGLSKRNNKDIVDYRQIKNLNKFTILNFLESNINSKFTINEIIIKTEKQFSYDQVRFILRNLIRNGEIHCLKNNNTNYYYSL